MPKFISIANHKGGVGKTTTTVNLADAIGIEGKRVLVVDGDPQSNATSSLLKEMHLREQFSLVKALELPPKEGMLSSMACPTGNANVQIVPTTLKFMEWSDSAGSSPDSSLGFARLIRNDTGLDKFDFVIIDTPPNLGVPVNNALMVSDYVIIPIPVSDQYAIDGFGTFVRLLEKIRYQNNKLKLLGVLMTKIDSRAKTTTSTQAAIKSFFKSKSIQMCETSIRVNIDLNKAATKRKTIFEFDVQKKKSGSRDYLNLAKEVIKRAV